MSDILVSIRCLVYNHEPYLRQCLEGFVMQKTNFAFEAIVHDDASTDNSAAIIREYAEKYPDIIKPIFENENQYSKQDGSIQKIINGAVHPKAKYIALCEGDDYWIDENKLQKQIDYLEEHADCSLCFHDAITIDYRTGDEINKFKIPSKQVITTRDLFLYGWFVPTASIVYRSYLKPSSEWYDKEFRAGDFVLLLYASKYGYLHSIGEKRSVYRFFVPSSATHTGSKIKKPKFSYTNYLARINKEQFENKYSFLVALKKIRAYGSLCKFYLLRILDCFK